MVRAGVLTKHFICAVVKVLLKSGREEARHSAHQHIAVHSTHTNLCHPHKRRSFACWLHTNSNTNIIKEWDTEKVEDVRNFTIYTVNDCAARMKPKLK